MAKAYIGTSGFSYPHWKGNFYPKDLPSSKWFTYYCQHFSSVELNVSFYRLPKKEVFANWRRRAGPKFVFSIKGSRFITHIKKLKDCQEAVKSFFEAADSPKKRNVVLWQLPPGLKVNPERLELFLEILPKNWRYAFEFRDESWLSKEIYELLKKYNAAVVFQDFPGWPIAEEVTTDFIYLRFHGRTRLYTSNYSEAELEVWAKKVKNWLRKGIDVYAYFNNDALGYAVTNARQLKKRLTS